MTQELRYDAKLPNSQEEVTAEWLTEALSSNYPGVAVESVHFGTIIEGTGAKIRLLLDYNQAGHKARLPATMWIKGAFHEYGKNIRAAFEREALFYNKVAPQNIVRCPQSYFTGVNRESGQGIVLMEDLLASNTRFGDPTQAVAPQVVAETLKMQAKLHALWWESPELEQIGERGGSLREDGVIDRLMQEDNWNWAMSLPRSRGIPPALRDRQRVHRAMQQTFAMNDELPECLLHGDPHLGNMYFTQGGDIGFLDWQRMMRGPWIFDVAYTLCGFLEPGDRRSHEQSLLSLYLAELAAQGVPAPAFDEAWRLYRMQLFYGMAWVVVPHGTQPEDACEQVSTRFATAIMDNDSLELFD